MQLYLYDTTQRLSCSQGAFIPVELQYHIIEKPASSRWKEEERKISCCNNWKAKKDPYTSKRG